MSTAHTLICFTMLALAEAVCAGGAQPIVGVSAEAVTLTTGAQTVEVGLSDAVITLKSPHGTYRFVPHLQHAEGWVQPSRVSRDPKIVRLGGQVHVELQFPVVGDREFALDVDVYPGIRAVFVTSQLRILSKPRPEYYFWGWSQAFDHYWVSKRGKTHRVEVDKSKSSELGFNDWFFLPSETGGLALFSRGEVGRGPGEKGTPHIWALPRSKYLTFGNSMDAGFGICAVKNADEAERLWRLVRARNIPALNRVPDKPAGIDYGRPAPDWLRNAENYNGFYHAAPAWNRTNIREKLSHFPLIVGVPHDAAVIDRCHRAGIRVIAYVNYMELLDTEVELKAKGGLYYEWLQSADHESLDLARRPDWICIDEKGELVKSIWGANYGHPGLFYTCFHQSGLQEAALNQVRKIMEMGADGVFIDNAGAVADCFGDKVGKHSHLDPSKNNTQMYESLQRRIYDLVKSFGEDKIVMQNSGIIPSHWAYCDAQMWEACVWGTGTPERMQKWEELKYAAEEAAEAVRHGKAVVILSYLDAAPEGQALDRALYAYAYARLYGFLWADWFGLEKTPGCAESARRLYALRLGKPSTDVRECKGVFYRAFEKGIVLLNPTSSGVSLEIPAFGFGKLECLGRGGSIVAAKDRFKLTLPPETGWVLVK